MEKNITISLLLDCYGAFLTRRQHDALRMHVDDDMSLAEIAKNLSITRQGVHDALRRGEAALREYEKALRVLARSQEQAALCAQALNALGASGQPTEPGAELARTAVQKLAQLWEDDDGL